MKVSGFFPLTASPPWRFKVLHGHKHMRRHIGDRATAWNLYFLEKNVPELLETNDVETAFNQMFMLFQSPLCHHKRLTPMKNSLAPLTLTGWAALNFMQQCHLCVISAVVPLMDGRTLTPGQSLANWKIYPSLTQNRIISAHIVASFLGIQFFLIGQSIQNNVMCGLDAFILRSTSPD